MQEIVQQELKRNEPSTLQSLLLAFTLFVAEVIGYALVQGSSALNDNTDPSISLLIFMLMSRCAITALAVKGQYPKKHNALTYIGVFILGCVPILAWIALYWAGKGVARWIKEEPQTPSIDNSAP